MEVAKTWFVLGAGQAKTLMPTLHTLKVRKLFTTDRSGRICAFSRSRLRAHSGTQNVLATGKKKARHSERPPEGEVFVYRTGRSGQNGA